MEVMDKEQQLTQPDSLHRYKKLFNKLREKIYRSGSAGLVRFFYDIDYIGFEKIPDEGPGILICNHVSYMDGIIIDSAIKRPVRYMIDKNIYNTPFVHHFMHLYNAIPIEPNRESVEIALATAEKALRNGELVFIFPEGQLTHTGNMRRFRYGVEWILKRYPVPVYPMALKGLWGSIFSRKYKNSKFKFLPRSFRRKVTLIIGDPIPPEIANIGYLQRVVMGLKNSISQNK